MKVGIWLYSAPKMDGGGYSYSDRLIDCIKRHKFSDEVEIVFVTDNEFYSDIYTQNTVKIKYPKLFHILHSIPNRLIKPISTALFGVIIRNIISPLFDSYLTKILELNSINLLFYPYQAYCRLQNFPFISTNWDIGHRSCFSFPEFHADKVFQTRNYWYNETINKAITITAESQTGKIELMQYANLNPTKISVLHIFPGNCTEIIPDFAICKENNLIEKKYFFYPAQFWPHKNHANLLYAFKSVLAMDSSLKLVFTGSDKGNLKYLQCLTVSLGLQHSVLFLGFVGTASIAALYKNALALTMPTFLGPTNMPLLEARELECPVLCSDLPGHREQMGDGALYFNPISHQEMTKCMELILNQSFRNSLIEKAKIEKAKSPFNEKTAITELETILLNIARYRKCWGNSSDLLKSNP